MTAEHLTITTTRTIQFPVQQVWKAWTDPAILCKWWGPKGFTNTFHAFTFCVGGSWIYTMHGPEGGNFENDAWFTKIEAQSVLEWNRNSSPRFYTSVHFEKPDDSKTRIVWKMIFKTEEMYDRMVKFVPGKNEENLDRLEEQLRSLNG